MANTNHETAPLDELSAQPNADRARKVIEEVCAAAGASVAIEQRLGGGESQSAQRRHLHITYNGESPMPYPQWTKLVDRIDTALDPSGLIDWESSELSGENEEERMAGWALLPATD